MLSASHLPERRGLVVAIPAKDEAARIGACLLALGRQTQAPDAVLLLLNNTTDRTDAVAWRLAPLLPFDLYVECRSFPPTQANAGHARREAMASAARLAGHAGVLLTTDADAVVSEDWVAGNLAALAAGADLVCGRIEVDPGEAAQIPAHLHADDALECELIRLLDHLAASLDPDPADPWPRHTEAAGASLAVTVAAFERVGGIPPMVSGEDRGFAEALRRTDARIRHDPAIRVMVSGRIEGRAPGGMADTIRRRMERQDEFTDAGLEPAPDAFRRIDFRRRLRLAWQEHQVGPLSDAALAADLGVRPESFEHALGNAFFGAAWAEVEAASPFLVRRRVRFADLPRQIGYAQQLLRQEQPDDWPQIADTLITG
jgi:hypothetical protein